MLLAARIWPVHCEFPKNILPWRTQALARACVLLTRTPCTRTHLKNFMSSHAGFSSGAAKGSPLTLVMDALRSEIGETDRGEVYVISFLRA